jgi:hypothetical protein
MSKVTEFLKCRVELDLMMPLVAPRYRIDRMAPGMPHKGILHFLLLRLVGGMTKRVIGRRQKAASTLMIPSTPKIKVIVVIFNRSKGTIDIWLKASFFKPTNIFRPRNHCLPDGDPIMNYLTDNKSNIVNMSLDLSSAIVSFIYETQLPITEVRVTHSGAKSSELLGVKTLALAKRFFGPGARRASVNPVLYRLQQQGLIYVTLNANGSDPYWHLPSVTSSIVDTIPTLQP